MSFESLNSASRRAAETQGEWWRSPSSSFATGCLTVLDFAMQFHIELEREDDGRWIAEIVAVPGALAYGSDLNTAVARVQALAQQVLADRANNRNAIAAPPFP